MAMVDKYFATEMFKFNALSQLSIALSNKQMVYWFLAAIWLDYTNIHTKLHTNYCQ